MTSGWSRFQIVPGLQAEKLTPNFTAVEAKTKMYAGHIVSKL